MHAGTIPPELGTFHNLETLSLRVNRLEGEIPGGWRLPHLQTAELDRNYLTGVELTLLGLLAGGAAVNGCTCLYLLTRASRLQS